MIKSATRILTLAGTLAVLAAPFGKLLAQSTPAPTPAAVTGTDPEPQSVMFQTFLALLGL